MQLDFSSGNGSRGFQPAGSFSGFAGMSLVWVSKPADGRARNSGMPATATKPASAGAASHRIVRDRMPAITPERVPIGKRLTGNHSLDVRDPAWSRPEQQVEPLVAGVATVRPSQQQRREKVEDAQAGRVDVVPKTTRTAQHENLWASSGEL